MTHDPSQQTRLRTERLADGNRVLLASGHSVLDDSAAESVWAIHIPAPPKELGWSEREIDPRIAVARLP